MFYKITVEDDGEVGVSKVSTKPRLPTELYLETPEEVETELLSYGLEPSAVKEILTEVEDA